MRRCSVIVLVLSIVGCASKPTLQPGDVIRPQIAFAPEAPWKTGTKATLSLLVEIHRQGRKVTFLDDRDALTNQADMKGKVTFFADDVVLGEPLEVSFVRDC